MDRIIQTIAFIALNTAIGLLGGFVPTVIGLFVLGIEIDEIDFARQKDIFLPTILFGT
ncbi:MAG: hypothetical protein KME14_09140 [Tildeniella torsiva UHER 1998/13D]|jgi:hypothetical protein|nr:hypothetical protein [Tildeniella torsiva UHER 1998/13D]